MFRSIWAQSHGLALPDWQPREGGPGTGHGGSGWAGSPTTALPGFLYLQRHLKCQNLPQSPQMRLPGLSRPKPSRGCSQQALTRGAWSGPPSRTAPGRRRAWTTPTRSPGSLPSPEASPGQAGGREGQEQVGSGGGTVQETPILRVMVGGMSPSLRTPEPLDGGIPAADLSPIPPISSSPASTPQDGPSESSPASCYVVPVRNVAGQRQGRISAPATPEMQGRRGQSQPLR